MSGSASPPVSPPAPPASTAPPAPGPSPDDSIRSLLGLARTFALLFAGLAGLLFLIFLALAFVETVLGRGPGDVVAVAYCAVSAAVNFLIWREIPTLQRAAAAGQYGPLREQLLVWAILGIVFFVVAGVILLLVWVKVDLRASSSPKS
jgi:hypothetical protein